MLLFKCPCGKAHIANEADAGQAIYCENCGNDLIIPNTSDPDCVLLFRRGAPEEGIPYSATEFDALLKNEELFSHDLIWQENRWLPLGEVYQMPEETIIEIEGNEVELALSFNELSPIEGYPKAPRKKRRNAKVKAKTNSSQAAEVKSLKQRIFTTIKAVVIIVILFYGLVRFGRIINYFLHKGSNILVTNNFDRNSRFKIPGYDWVELPQNSRSTIADVYVAFPSKVKMSFADSEYMAALPENKTSATSEKYNYGNLRVPVRPGYDTVVNPGSKSLFGVYDFNKIKDYTLSSAELKRLSNEISAAKAPNSVQKVIEQIQDLGKDAYIETRTDQFFSSKDFSFEKIGLVRSSAAPEVKKVIDESLYQLVYPEKYTLNFKNGSLFYDPEKVETERNILLVSKEFKPNKNYSCTTNSNPRLQIRYDKNNLVLQLSGLSSEIKGPLNAVYKAQWTYQARMNNVGQWTWNWTANYQKPADGKNPAEKITLTIDQNGKEKSKKEIVK